MSDMMAAATMQNIRMSVRFNHVIFPLNMLAFARSLPERGFQLMTELPPPDPKTLGRPTFSGRLAVRGTSAIDVNSDKQFIGVTDPEPQRLRDTFEEIFSLLMEENLNGGPLNPWFFELQVKIGVSIPPERTEPLRKSIPEVEAIVGFPVRRKGARLSSAISADTPNYFELVIEPVVGMETSLYDLVIIMRNENIEVVLDMLGSLNENVIELAISAIRQ